MTQLHLRRKLNTIRWFICLALVATFALVPAAAVAQDGIQSSDEGVLVRVNGDAAIGADESVAVAVVVSGDFALIESDAEVVVVVSGVATIDGSRVETLVVVDGRAELTNGARVSGDVWLTNSTLNEDGTTEVIGSVRRDAAGLAAGFWVFALLMLIGLGVLALLGSQVLAAIAPNTVRRAGLAIRQGFGSVVLAGLALWILVPILAWVLIITVVGIPTALAIFLVVLPMMGFVGYLVTGILLGELILGRRDSIGHPYLAAFVGTLVLVLVGLIPGLGAIVGALAGLLGSSALALVAWRSFRSTPEEIEPSEPEDALSAGAGT